MSDSWGNRIKLTIFGESHGPAIGVVVGGLPPGLAVDEEAIRREMARRAPGTGPLATARKEADEPEILSGLHGGKTTGSALCAIIRNRDAQSRSYGTVLRPGHADWTALLKYGGHADMRGGGHFSGRLTAPLVFAGALAKQVLAGWGIAIKGRITAIGGIVDESGMPALEGWPPVGAPLGAVVADAAEVGKTNHMGMFENQPTANAPPTGPAAATGTEIPSSLPVADAAKGRAMAGAILAAKAEGDSLGGVIEVAAFGVPGGWGEPFFDSVESVAASLFFAIPAVKAVEFGGGFALAQMCGSAANDPLVLENGAITAESNHNGGLLGGITNGMPVVARLGVKPTPSIAKPQRSVDAATMAETEFTVAGRHDPCIVPRCVPVAEAALALALWDSMPAAAPLPGPHSPEAAP